MDATLQQILRALFEAHQEIDRLRESLRQVQAAYTDLKHEQEVRECPTKPSS